MLKAEQTGFAGGLDEGWKRMRGGNEGSKALARAPGRMRLPFTETGSLQEKQILEEDQKPGFPVNFGMSKWHPGENAEGRGSCVFMLEFQKVVGTEI